MSFREGFCSSLWIHMRINSHGKYEYCRWTTPNNRTSLPSIREQTPIEFFQKGEAPIRKRMLEGETFEFCSTCKSMEQHKKVSGRQKQLLKTGITTDHFVESFLSSPWLPEFQYSAEHNGETTQLPQDWQIDLGNYCNNACVTCSPISSSQIALEYKKIGLISEMPPVAWCHDPVLLNKFLDTLKQSRGLRYLHFLGGETLITPAFRTMLEFMVEHNLHKTVTIGFTTNLSTWDQDIVDLLVQFDQVNLGLSIECLHPLNDYLRYGSKINQVTDLMTQWIEISKQYSWYTQLRVTPSVFSIWHLDTIYEYAYNNDIVVESCNFLTEPAHMRLSVLPVEFRQPIIKKLENWSKDKIINNTQTIINIRNPSFVKQQIVEDLNSYVNYLKDPHDESYRLPDLVAFVKKLEASRNNSIIKYLPEYEQLLISAGY